ncbi:NAD(P)-binding domain-containing protein [Acuticoccus yangtzensis]|uniref:NAD(P)-binding domain-containing protein n=1 Tax=Acuticoccus yangtzensis TaxID=1443441 RepID=UPI000B1CF3AE|nr:NAD(P)/FAD-dependent oxidoreductase [Acuticoccus yangtzensis]
MSLTSPARTAAEPHRAASESDGEAAKTAPATPDGAGLAELEQRLARDLQSLMLPPRDWVPPATGPGGAPMRSVIVIGAGMYGIAAALSLRLEGVADTLLIERAQDGLEGPWITFARMPTLRSPKTLPGPAARLPALTFRSWYEAAYGTDAWDTLYKASNGDWQAYLTWVRRVMDLPTRTGTAVTGLTPAADHVRLDTAAGPLFARRVVLAAGRNRDAAYIPPFVAPGLRPGPVAHTCDEIDFAALAGRDVAVIGGGASAWDNAATALEAGARVTQYVRRDALPQINKSRAPSATSPGLLRGWPRMPDAVRWSMAHYAALNAAPPPHETVLRTIAHPAFDLRFGHDPVAVEAAGDGVRLRFRGGIETTTDFLILGTGFSSDIEALPLLAPLASRIMRWGARYTPPAHEANAALASAPYLGPGFELMEDGGAAGEGLSRIHLFLPAGHLSMGAILTDVPGVNIGGDTLARSIVEHLALETVDALRADVEAFAELELTGTPYVMPSV